MTPKSWPDSEAKQLRLVAKQLFKCDMHEQHDEYRDQCGACVLRGYLSESAIADGFTAESGPNYAGWARCYVQAGVPIPLHWRQAFEEQRNSDNKPYARALERDIATFGLKFD